MEPSRLSVRPFGVNFKCVPRRILAMMLIGFLLTVRFSTTADAKGGEPLTSYVVVPVPA